MNKTDMTAALAAKQNISKAQAGEIIDALFGDTGIIAAALKSGDKVAVTGFGTFSVSQRAARKGISPKTKQPIDIPASRTPRFKAGKNLKAAI